MDDQDNMTLIRHQIFLERYRLTLEPHMERMSAYRRYGIEYAQIAVRAAFILNGGGLFALPAVLEITDRITVGDDPGLAALPAALLFAMGIVFAAMCALTASLNFHWHEASAAASLNKSIYRLYDEDGAIDPEHEVRIQAADRLEKSSDEKIHASHLIGHLAGIFSYLLFIAACISLIS